MGKIGNYNDTHNYESLRFKYLFPDFETFVKKVNSKSTPIKIDDDTQEILYEELYDKFANREFRWESDFQCISRLRRIWKDNYWIYKQMGVLRKKLEEDATSGITLENETKVYNTGNNLDSEESIDEKYLTGGVKGKDRLHTPIGTIQEMNKLNSQQEEILLKFSGLFLPYIN